MIRILILSLLFLVPAVSANTADIPALTGTGTTVERFVAGWATSDGATVPAGNTQYFAMFGDSAPRNTESDIAAQATFHYNITNFRVASNVAACGGLTGAQTFTFAVRLNGADTALTGTCTSASAANSFTLATDIVAVAPGDRLTIRVTQVGAILGVTLRAGLTLEGFKTIPVNIMTTPVPDMVNEMLETFNVLAPLLLFAVLVAWAEISRDLLVYVLALACGVVMIPLLWSEMTALTLVLVAAVALIAYRAFEEYESNKEAIDGEI